MAHYLAVWCIVQHRRRLKTAGKILWCKQSTTDVDDDDGGDGGSGDATSTTADKKQTGKKLHRW